MVQKECHIGQCRFDFREAREEEPEDSSEGSSEGGAASSGRSCPIAKAARKAAICSAPRCIAGGGPLTRTVPCGDSVTSAPLMRTVPSGLGAAAYIAKVGSTTATSLPSPSSDSSSLIETAYASDVFCSAGVGGGAPGPGGVSGPSGATRASPVGTTMQATSRGDVSVERGVVVRDWLPVLRELRREARELPPPLGIRGSVSGRSMPAMPTRPP
mmetsp:Transcript_9295/g.27383  ORF Transcript_9295/g.27383 Transcript_9295/m.27383 type:complete len:214 (-) Transcript_9295:755-1396(-)